MESRTNCLMAAAKTELVVIFLPEVRNQILSHHPAQRVFQLHRLNKQVVLGIQARRRHRRLKVEAQPLLDSVHTSALCKVQEENQVQNDRRSENGIPAKEIHLNLHRVS